MRLIHLLILLFISLRLTASTLVNVDSLRATVEVMPNDSNKVIALNDIAFKYRNHDPVLTIELAKVALNLAVQLNYEWEKPRSFSFIGIGYQKQGQFSTAIEYYQKAKEIAEKIKNQEELAYAFHNMGTVYKLQNNYEIATDYYYQSLRIFETLSDLRGIAYANNSLSIIASTHDNFDLAIQHAEQTLEIRKKLNDIRGQNSAYNRLGEVYLKKGEIQKALDYFFRNIKSYTELEDYEGLAYTYINISSANLFLEKYTKAIYFSKKAIAYYNEIGNEGMAAEAMQNIANAAFFMADYQRSKRYAEKIMDYALKNNRLELLANSYFRLSKINEIKKAYEPALYYYQQYSALTDSIFSAASYREVGRQQGSFEIFKKDQENELLKQQKEISQAVIRRQKQQTWSLIGGLFLVLALVFVLVRANRRRQKDNQLLLQKNNQIEDQRTAITEQTLELEKAKKQLQGYNERLEQKVTLRTEALKKSNEELELYANLASHDLKQPLRNIGGFSNLLVRHLKKNNLDDKQTKEYTNFIISSTQYMHNLIEDLLAFSQFSSDSHEASIEQFDYKDVIGSVLQNLHQQVQDTKANIVLLNIPEEGKGFKIKLTQLFQNLISNALKFSKKDVPAVICIDSKDIGTHYQFSLADNGIGIEKEYFNMIFETFKKLHNKQKYSGVGLGLSTCKKIVEQHKGEIWLESVPNEGTTFHFTILK